MPPEYFPRTFLTRSSRFGKREPPRLVWRLRDPVIAKLERPDTLEELQGSASQHEYCLAFQEAFQRVTVSPGGCVDLHRWADRGAFCRDPEVSVSYSRLSCVLRGDALMRPEDIGLFAHLLGADALPAPGTVANRVAWAIESNDLWQTRDAKSRRVHSRDRKTERTYAGGAGQPGGQPTSRTSAMETDMLDTIRKKARPYLEHSMAALRAELLVTEPAFCEGWGEPVFGVEIEIAEPGRRVPDRVYAMPTEDLTHGAVWLDESWLRTVESVGTAEVEDHFIVHFEMRDGPGRPWRVRALRLLPTAFTPHSFGDWEYAASHALVRFGDGAPTLEWIHKDLMLAAHAWCIENGDVPPGMFDES